MYRLFQKDKLHGVFPTLADAEKLAALQRKKSKSNKINRQPENGCLKFKMVAVAVSGGRRNFLQKNSGSFFRLPELFFA